jgi:hypothetical protein
MRYGKMSAVAVVALGAVFPLVADDISATSDTFMFSLRTSGGTMNMAELSAWPITYKAGDIITLISPSGVSTTPVDGVTTAGATDLSSSSLDEDGVWTLRNSNGGMASIGVTWGTNGESLSETDADGNVVLFTVGDGPDRKLKKSEVPPVAYSGDDWAGDLSKAAMVTFTPPEGSGLEATTWGDLSGGNGARTFTFNARGVWTVTLKFADNTTCTAQIDIQTAGFMLIVK